MSMTEDIREGFYLSDDGEWIPDGWSSPRIGDVGKVVTGKTPSKENPHHWGNKVDFITPTDFTNSRKLVEVARKLSEDGENAFSRQITEAGSIAVSCIGSDMGKVILTNERSLTNQQINTLTVDDNHFNLFWYYRIVQSYPLLRSLAEGGGSTMPIVNKGQFENIRITAPKYDEQKAIADVLGSLDDKIELLREQNETLEALAQTLFKRWFIDFNFPDDNGNPYKDSGGNMVASEFGEIPEGWKADKLDDYISISGGGTPSTKEPSYWNGEIAWSSPKDLSDRPDPFLFETNKTITDEGLGAISSELNPVGSLLLSSRAPIGYIAFADVSVAVNQGYIVFAPEQHLSNQFMFLWLKKHMNVVTNAANGSTFLEISKKTFKEIETVIPNEGVLRNFQHLVMPHFEKLRNNLIQIETLTQLRDTLLPKLMKGEIRIKSRA